MKIFGANKLMQCGEDDTITMSADFYTALIEASIKNDIIRDLVNRDPDGYVDVDFIRLVIDA